MILIWSIDPEVASTKMKFSICRFVCNVVAMKDKRVEYFNVLDSGQSLWFIWSLEQNVALYYMSGIILKNKKAIFIVIAGANKR